MEHAMILAAGKGTRLGDLGRAQAKVLIDVGGQPLLVRHLSMLESIGVQRVVINVSHLAGQVKDAALRYGGPVEVVCIEETELLGTAGGVRNALDRLMPGPFMVVYGDVLVQDDLAPMIETHEKHGGLATLAVHRSDSAFGKGTVSTDLSGRIMGFVEKDPAASAGTGSVLINSGVYILDGGLLSGLEPGVVCDFGHDVFPQALAAGTDMFVYELPHSVIDIGTPEGLLKARKSAGGDQPIADS